MNKAIVALHIPYTRWNPSRRVSEDEATELCSQYFEKDYDFWDWLSGNIQGHLCDGTPILDPPCPDDTTCTMDDYTLGLRWASLSASVVSRISGKSKSSIAWNEAEEL